jgi:hypothetical protein
MSSSPTSVIYSAELKTLPLNIFFSEILSEKSDQRKEKIVSIKNILIERATK